jgi:hypothetical protein
MLRNDHFFHELRSYRADLVESPKLWRFSLWSASAFASFAGKYGIESFTGDTIEKLWAVGLLRAERVQSNDELHIEGLQLVSQDRGVFTYFDGRQVALRPAGYGGCFNHAEMTASGLELSFHPFRLYVLHHIHRVFQLDVAPYQYLMNPEGYEPLVRRIVSFKDEWTKTHEFRDRFEDWNRTAELAIALEPVCYSDVFGAADVPSLNGEHSIRDELDAARSTVRALLEPINALSINQVRQELCTSAEFIDENKLLHVLLRIMAPRERLKLRSGLGLSMHLLAMAEILRRAFEKVHGIELDEEDELGFGQWMQGARKTVFGSERVLDAPMEVKRDFLTSMGLDGGTKARVYVEGDTEAGALRSAVGDAAGTEIINLRGRVVERGDRGLSFADSLKINLRSHVFSLVLIDADRTDEVRVLKKAAREEQFFGAFFVAQPDFEFGNFTRNELVEIAVAYGKTVRHIDVDLAQLRSAAMEAISNKEFEAAWKSCRHGSLKCEEWGTALMNFAIEHPHFPDGDARCRQLRPIIEAARMVVQSRIAGYLRSVERSRVDPESGNLVPR